MLVLPTLPVIAIICVFDFSLTYFANLINARCVFFTLICGILVFRFFLSTIAKTAPLFFASIIC